MTYRGVAFDLDGTLLNPHGELTGITKTILQNLANRQVHLIVASGRTFSSLPDALRNFRGIEYAITGNGAAVYRLADKACVLRHVMESTLVREIISFTESFPIQYEFYSNGIAYTEDDVLRHPEKYGLTGYAVQYVQRTRRPIGNIDDFINTNFLEGVSLSVTDPGLKAELWGAIQQAFPGVMVTSSVPRLLEIADQKVSKGQALKNLLPIIGLNEQDIIAFGDAHNDIDMLTLAGLGVAMGNADEDIKKIADHIAPSNKESGLAICLQEIFNI